MTMPVASTRRHALVAVLAASTAVLLALIFLRIMNFEMRKDEMLYVPPATLLDDQTIYRDFFYNHTPASAWLFHFIYKATGSEYLLLSGRLGIVLAWLVLASGIAAITYFLTRSAYATWCITILALINELFLGPTGMTATNNLLPLSFAYLGIGLFLIGTREGRTHVALCFSSGVLLALAVSFKISAIAYLLPIAVAAFLMPSRLSLRHRMTQIALPLLAGGLVGGLPILIPLMTDPERFIAHVVGYHVGPHRDYWRSGAPAETDAALSLGAKLFLARDIWLSGAISASIVAMITLYIFRARQASGALIRKLMPSGEIVLILAILACTIAMSLIPTPGFPQYFALPLICLPLLLALLYAGLSTDNRHSALPVLMSASLVVLAIGLPRLVQFAPLVTHPDSWTVTKIHDVGRDLADRVAEQNLTGKIATLAPIYPLEGGLKVYPELATGPFAYRTADLTAPDLARNYRMTSPTRVGALFDEDPPAAIVLGFDPQLEQPMLDYTERHGYQPIDLGVDDHYGHLVAYLRPTRATPPVALRENLQSLRPSAP